MTAFLSHLPETILREVEEGRAAVVGGAVRSHFDHTPVADIDIFVFSQEKYEEIVRQTGASEVAGSDGRISRIPGEVPVDLLWIETHSSAEECVKQADFDIASGVYSAGRFMFAPSFQEAVATRQALFLGSDNPQRSYFRYLKYNRQYGYRIDGGSLQRLLAAWSESVKN